MSQLLQEQTYFFQKKWDNFAKSTGGAGYKTLHKIAVRSYKQPFGGQNLKKRGLIITSKGLIVRSNNQPPVFEIYH